MGYRNYSVAKGLIVDSTGHGDFTSIQSAINAASAGQTIFVRPGTYTENLTLKARVNISAFDCDQQNGSVLIQGKISHSTSGTVSISGVRLQTNSDNLIEITGSSASIIRLVLCNLIISSNVGINMTSSSSGAFVFLRLCNSLIQSTATFFTVSGAGSLLFSYCDSGASGSTTRSTFSSSGVLTIDYSTIGASLTTSGSSSISADYSILFADVDAGGIVLGGSGAFQVVSHCTITGQVTINNTTFLILSSVSSAQVNALTGAGTLKYGQITFFNSSGHNVATETALGTL